MKYRDTVEMREYLDKLVDDLDGGKMTNAAARIRVGIAKAKLDTIKIEIAACALGRDFSPVAFDKPKRRQIEVVRRSDAA